MSDPTRRHVLQTVADALGWAAYGRASAASADRALDEVLHCIHVSEPACAHGLSSRAPTVVGLRRIGALDGFPSLSDGPTSSATDRSRRTVGAAFAQVYLQDGTSHDTIACLDAAEDAVDGV